MVTIIWQLHKICHSRKQIEMQWHILPPVEALLRASFCSILIIQFAAAFNSRHELYASPSENSPAALARVFARNYSLRPKKRQAADYKSVSRTRRPLVADAKGGMHTRSRLLFSARLHSRCINLTGSFFVAVRLLWRALCSKQVARPPRGGPTQTAADEKCRRLWVLLAPIAQTKICVSRIVGCNLRF